MKKVFYILAFAGLVVSACNKENPAVQEPASTPGTYTYVIDASFASDMTKTEYANDKTFSWSQGDQISVLFHNGDDNQFFTFTATKGGSATTRFEGEVTDGYTIGASNNSEKWALYPANPNHAYLATSSVDAVRFYIPGEFDFTAPGAHHSVNMPMWARGDDNDCFTFKGLTACYKFTFTGLTNVSKVKLTVENKGNGYYLSGRSPLQGNGDDLYLEMYQDEGSTTVSITDNVSSGTATFYVNARCWDALASNITLQNMDAGDNYENIIYKATAVNTLTGIAQARICVVPSCDLSAYGVGVPFWSAFGVNWSSIDMYADDSSKDAFPGEGNKIVEWKATSDDTDIYFYFKTVASAAQTAGQWESYIVTGFDTDNDPTTGEAGSYGLGDGFEARSLAYPYSNDVGSPVTFRLPTSPNTSSKILCPISGSSLGYVETNGGLKGDYAFVEIRIPRNKIGSPSSGATIRVRHAFGWTPSPEQTITLE